MEEKYEVVLFRPIKDLDLVNLLSNLFGREELGVRVRQIGERLNLLEEASQFFENTINSSWDFNAISRISQTFIEKILTSL